MLGGRGGGRKVYYRLQLSFKNLTADLGKEIPPFIISCNQEWRSHFAFFGVTFAIEARFKRRF